MMTREALEAALDLWDHDHQVIKGDLVGTASLVAHAVEFFPLAEAARRQLALMPEVCGTCGGRGIEGGDIHSDCPTCHGSGKVYPQETVERIIEGIRGRTGSAYSVIAVAVLDALGESE